MDTAQAIEWLKGKGHREQKRKERTPPIPAMNRKLPIWMLKVWRDRLRQARQREIADLQGEMAAYCVLENYEKAAVVRDTIKKVADAMEADARRFDKLIAANTPKDDCDQDPNQEGKNHDTP